MPHQHTLRVTMTIVPGRCGAARSLLSSFLPRSHTVPLHRKKLYGRGSICGDGGRRAGLGTAV
ncbi:hypothetical protein GY45DRAFT_1010488 [Cubamyces sp. BRFM 1775]|nr:hypothetical protein GY45DRAFT_1010488 [Cubamyces sp. BRFM 1775]